jgi:hypothetical protein
MDSGLKEIKADGGREIYIYVHLFRLHTIRVSKSDGLQPLFGENE